MTISKNDPRLPNLLIIVRRIAKAMARRLPSSVALEDLVAAGNLGVATAMTRYGESSYGIFEAFAIAHARGAMLDELRRADPIPRVARRRLREATKAIKSLRGTLGREPEDAEVATDLGISEVEYRELQRLGSAVNVSVDTCADRADRDALVLADEESFEEAAERHDEQVYLRRVLSAEVALLPPREAASVALSFSDDVSLGEIAARLGVTASRVCQLRKAALKRLREACVANDIGTSELTG